MKNLYALFICFILVQALFAQNGLFVYGNVDNPNGSIELDVIVHSENIAVSALINSESDGTIPNTWIPLESALWQYMEVNFQICNGTDTVYFFYPDSLNSAVEVDISVDFCPKAQSYGCTDSLAVNYNPWAIIDSGICFYEDSCDLNELEIVINAQEWFTEMFWEITADSVVVASESFYTIGSNFTFLECLPNGCYQFTLANASGNLSNEDSIELSLNGTPILSDSLISSPFGALGFSINTDGCLEGSIIYGCTDSLAVNYNPDADIDDNSCMYNDCDENALLIDIQSGEWGYEMSWTISSDGVIYAEQDDFEDYSSYTSIACLPNGCYFFNMLDTYGDGWNGGYFELSLNGAIVSSGSLYDGDSGSIGFSINQEGCIETPVFFGCTDPGAANYNPIATIDDGSCIDFEPPFNDICFSAIPLLSGYQNMSNEGATTNEIIPAPCWAYESDEYELNTVWYSFTTPSIPAQIHIATVGDGSNTLTNTQIALYDSCGSSPLYCDDDSGQDTFSELVFACGELPVSTTYYLVVNGFLGQTGSCLLYRSTNVLCNSDIYGCTDSLALNYNPMAFVDDQSCIYPKDCNISFLAIPDSLGEDVFYIYPSQGILAADSLLWSFGDGFYSTDTFPYHEYEGDGPYMLCLSITINSDSIPCTNSYCLELNGNDVGGPGIQEGSFSINTLSPIVSSSKDLRAQNDLDLWPNPTTALLNIKYDPRWKSNGTISIFDMTGKQVIFDGTSLLKGTDNVQLNVSTLENGIYIIQLKTVEAVYKGKFAIAR